MTEIVDPVIRSGSEARMDRLLDVAAGLLVRRGYRYVTIDDVAREAGVGKGTVYLHVRTKEALFLTVLLRAHRGVVTAMADRMDADPAAALPGPMMRGIYLDLAADPVTRALYLGDGEVLGRLAHEAADTLGEIARRRDDAVRGQFELLRDAGCLRTDRGLDEQLHQLGAVGAGFFFVDPMPSGVTDPAVRAELLEHALAATLQVPGAVPEEAAAAAVARSYRALIDHTDDEWRRRVRCSRGGR